MIRSRRPALLGLLLLTALPPALAGQAMERPGASRAVAMEAASLLRLAPAADLPGTLSDAAFLEAVHALESQAGRNDRYFTAEQALEGLVELAADWGPVFADVRSEPPGLPIQYRISFRPPDPDDPTTTTDNPSLRLDVPAWYWFRVSSGDSIVNEKLVDCVNGCTVVFDAPGPPPS